MSNHPVTPAITFKNHPEWPVYDSPALWYIQTGEPFGKREAVRVA